MARPRKLPNESVPIWSASRERSMARAPLVGDRDADVVVVGAGITGLTTALILARRGLEVVILEGGQLGQGTTGHTTAKVSALQGARYSAIARHHPADVVAAYATAQMFALDWIAATVENLQIPCRWERRPALTYVHDADSLPTLTEEADTAAAAGLDIELSDAADLPFPTAGAIALNDQAQFDPMAYLQGLAAELDTMSGASLYERSRVRSIRGSRRHRVETVDGTVRAGHVVVTTLLPIVDRGLFFARAEPKMSYSIAAEIDGDLPVGMHLSVDDPKRSLRTAWDGDREVLVVGGTGHTVGRATGTLESYRELAAWTAEHFRVRRIRARWCAHDIVPDDQLPWAGASSPISPRVLVAGGFAKWGMTNGTAAAHLLADQITGEGKEAQWARAFETLRVPPRAAQSTARINAGVATNMVRGWVRPRSDATAGEGSIARPGVVPTGRSAGESGQLEDRKLVCSHLGGICSWNDAERTWDCPLHGSRFATDGSVVAAPAVRPMGDLPRP